MVPVPADVIIFVIVAFIAGVSADIFFHRSSKEVKIWDSIFWSLFWVVIAIIFYFYLGYRTNHEDANLFLAGYVLEKSLSVDNLMVFAAIFASFNIKGIRQHKILYFGIIGAVVFRAIFVLIGTSLFGLSIWIEIIFGLIVAWTAIMMLKAKDEEEQEDYSNHWSVKFTKKIIPVLPFLTDKSFFVDYKKAAKIASDNNYNLTKRVKYYATPMLLCLICIEMSDIVFSFDSVPAVIAVTREPFLVYSAMIFAILGLRSLYFILIAATKYLRFLEKSVIVVLFYIAFKLIYSAFIEKFGWHNYKIDPTLSMWIVLGVIGLGVLISILVPQKKEKKKS